MIRYIVVLFLAFVMPLTAASTGADLSDLQNNLGSQKQETAAVSVPNEQLCIDSCRRGPPGATGATGPAGPTGATGLSGGLTDFADFFALMPGDNSAPVGAGDPVQFPQDGP